MAISLSNPASSEQSLFGITKIFLGSTTNAKLVRASSSGSGFMLDARINIPTNVGISVGYVKKFNWTASPTKTIREYTMRHEDERSAEISKFGCFVLGLVILSAMLFVVGFTQASFRGRSSFGFLIPLSFAVLYISSRLASSAKVIKS
ncbi:hypothetical protein ACQZ6F_17825 [Rhizobium sp. A22-96]